MEKNIKDGMVAVLISPGHGAGWYTWLHVEELLYDPKVVDMVEDKTSAETIERYCKEVYGANNYYGGARDLVVQWVPVGTHFSICEYDGHETLETRDEKVWIVA